MKKKNDDKLMTGYHKGINRIATMLSFAHLLLKMKDKKYISRKLYDDIGYLLMENEINRVLKMKINKRSKHIKKIGS